MGNAHGSAIMERIGLEQTEETRSVLYCFVGLPIAPRVDVLVRPRAQR
jgi:hypothetical protein